jgi:hypothetical protein
MSAKAPGKRGIAGLSAAPAENGDAPPDRAGMQEDAQRTDGGDMTRHTVLAGQGGRRPVPRHRTTHRGLIGVRFPCHRPGYDLAH